ncbi:MAG: 50S ribosomal protein L18 [Holosporaceae bacterium]|nr:50S ribosomal protein L18 [Holosporaceae bacterium]
MRRAKRVHHRARIKSFGKPRLSVFRSERHIYAQIIDDSLGKTLCSASTVDKNFDRSGKTSNRDAAAKVGTMIAERAKKAGIKDVVFDRGGCNYHGRVKALADGARGGGLLF